MAVVRFTKPEIDILNGEMGRLYNDFNLNNNNFHSEDWQPPVDMKETVENIVITFEIPGVKKENIKLNIDNNTLNISGDKKKKNGDGNYYRTECCYGSFQRSIVIPQQINREKVKAIFINGVLTVELPKREQIAPKTIEIKMS